MGPSVAAPSADAVAAAAAPSSDTTPTLPTTGDNMDAAETSALFDLAAVTAELITPTVRAPRRVGVRVREACLGSAELTQLHRQSGSRSC